MELTISTIGVAFAVFWVVIVPAIGLSYELIKDIYAFRERQRHAPEEREIKRMETEIELINARSRERREELELYKKSMAQ